MYVHLALLVVTAVATLTRSIEELFQLGRDCFELISCLGLFAFVLTLVHAAILFVITVNTTNRISMFAVGTFGTASECTSVATISAFMEPP